MNIGKILRKRKGRMEEKIGNSVQSQYNRSEWDLDSLR